MKHFSKLFTAIRQLASLTISRKSRPLSVRNTRSGLDLAVRLTGGK